MLKVILTLVAVAFIAVAGFFVFVYSGYYNVAASASHTDFAVWTLETVKLNSIRKQATNLEVPTALGTEAMQRAGLHEFSEMCVTCHGAPGVARSPIGEGQKPAPPSLQVAVGKYTPQELYWILKHGIRMTGMPAFGETHPDEELWNVVSFILELPDMTPEEYQERVQQAGLEAEEGAHRGAARGEHADAHGESVEESSEEAPE